MPMIPGRKKVIGGALLCLVVCVNALFPAASRGQVFVTNLPMITARYGHTATLLSNGKVLVTGGQTPGPITNLCELYDPSTGSWTNTAAMVTPRSAHTATLLPNGKVLVTGGLIAPATTTNLCELYDPTTGTWTNTGAMTAARLYQTATLLPNGKVLVCGGQNSVYLASAELYDPATGAWTATGTMKAVRAGHSIVVLTNGLALAMGGYFGSGYNTSSELFNPATGTWALTSGSMFNSRQRFSATLLSNGKVLVAGGAGSSGWLSASELYDPVAQSWTGTAGSMAGSHGDHTSAMLPNGTVLVPGGYNGSTPTASSEVYNPGTGTWSSAGNMNGARYFNTATMLASGKVLITGGYNGSAPTNSVELFDLTNATWTVSSALNTARNSQTATVLPNGRVLIAGGQNAAGITNSAEIFNSTNSTWTATNGLNVARCQHTATLLANGSALVAGGQAAGGAITNSAELYDPSAGAWTNTAPMSTARASHTATALADGRVLAAGGQSPGGPTNLAELYDPAQGWWTNTGSMNTARKNHSATLLPNGKILVVGGTNSASGNLASAELYDPTTGGWSNITASALARSAHTATLLPNGKVLVAGGFSAGATNRAELYNPADGTWTVTGSMAAARYAHTATLLLNGKVLVAGGTNSASNLSSAEVYDPVTGTWTTSRSLNTARSSHTATLLINGKVMLAGGLASTGTTNAMELYDAGLGFTNSWQPQITNLISTLTAGSSLVITGSQFRGISEANCGNTQDSPTDYPVVQLRNLENGQVLFPSITNWSTNSFTTTAITNFPLGYSFITVFVNGIPSTSGLLAVGKSVATVTLTNLAQTYDGTGKSASATTSPGGLAVVLTYNGSTSPPVNAGSYTVIATVNDLMYQGSATNTLVIARAGGTVALTGLSQTYDGAAKSAGATTTPNGLTVSFTYNGSSSAPTNAGNYTVIGGISDPNYQGSATNTLIIAKATGVVTLGNLNQSYNGTGRSVTATTTPAGLTVNFTYNGSATPPTNAGNYTVAGAISDSNYAGSATNTLTIGKASGLVAFNGTVQTYDGTARFVTTTTTPGGLAVALTYNDSATAPTNAGSYTIVGIINDSNYSGASTNTLVVNKATATVALGGLAQTYDGTARSATASTTPAGLTADLTYNGQIGAPTNAGSYVVIGLINEANYQGGATNTLVIGKASATVTLGNLAQTYDGTARMVTASTTPTNLLVSLTYNGSSNPATNAGNYTVIGSISESNYFGSATNTLVVSKTTATVALGNLNQTYDGTARSITATTTPSGLATSFTYNGGESAPTNAGSYAVAGAINDINYFGGATNVLVVNQAPAVIMLGSLNQTYNGSARSITATTTPSGLAVTFTYNGFVNAPTNTGSYTVIGTIADVNYFGSATNTLVIDQAPGTVTLGNLAQIYDGAAKSVTVSTTPTNLNVTVTYNGSANAPTNAGSYTVIGTINDSTYHGSATNTLVIARASAAITLGNLSPTYDGNGKPVAVTTAPTNLSVIVTYNGVGAAPTNAGSYNVIASVNDVNYQGSATNTLVIGRAAATVTLGSLAQTYDGTARVASSTTSPTNLAVNLTYNGAVIAPTNAGSYTVVGAISDVNYSGSATNTMVVGKAAGTLTFGGLSQTYNGSGRNVSATTTPPGLGVAFTYDGVSSAPTNAGTYSVVGTINDQNYAGTGTNNLVVSKGTATVTLSSLSQTYDGTGKSAGVSTSPGGLTVNLAYNGLSTTPINSGSYAVVGTISDANYQGSATNTFVIGKAAGVVNLANLAQTYDGSGKSASASTTPIGLAVNLTYNGSIALPTNAGSYTVIGILNDANYQGAATNTLVIAQAPATVTFGNLAQTYNGTARIVSTTTSPSNLVVVLSYNGSATAPTNAGNYTVTGVINDSNYFGGTSNTLVVAKAAGTVALTNLSQTYDGTGRTASATTTPAGLAVSLTYNGSSIPPTNAGSYTVIGTLNDVNYSGSSTNLLVVGQAVATVTLGSLGQTYDGTARIASAATVPSGLAVNFTYNGSLAAPTNAGSYAVVGTVSDVNYFGSATNTMIVARASATVTLDNLLQVYSGGPRAATATTAPAGLTVLFAYNGSTNAPTNAGSYAVVGTISDLNYAGSGSNTLVITRAVPVITLGNLAQTYDGTAKAASAVTSPPNLPVSLTYNGALWAPTNAGSYIVVGSVNDTNYLGSATNTLVINKGTAVVTLGSLDSIYNSSVKNATAVTTPPGLTVTFTYNGSPSAPSNAGSYAVVGTVSDANYQGGASGTMVVGKAAATMTIGNLAQTYDGTPRNVSATSNPLGLGVYLTYNGAPNAPTNAGSYSVVGSVIDQNYDGTQSNTLVVAQAAATVTFTNLSQNYNGAARSVTAITAPSGLTVNITYNSSASAPTNPGNYTVIGTIADLNYAGGATNTLVINQAPGTVILGNLSQTYDGTAKNVSVTTSPTNLNVSLTYNGVAAPPTNAGNYTVIATINDSTYSGSVTNTLTINKASGTVSLGNLTQTYDGAGKNATATTTPNGLAVAFTYNNLVAAPTNAGNYTVIGQINDVNYQGGATNTLVVGKGAATVALGALAQTYDGTARSATATTTPSGLTVNLTYNGSAIAPTNAGNYAVAGTINDVNYAGTTTNLLVVGKATVTVTLGSLVQTYDGTSRRATATTSPNGLGVSFTYNGSSTAPMNAGSYAVVGNINNVNYQGSATDTLVVSQAAATVTLGSLSQTYDGTARNATATTTPSGLTVAFSYNGLASAPTNAGNYTVIGTITDVNYFGSATAALVVATGTPTISIGNPLPASEGTATILSDGRLLFAGGQGTNGLNSGAQIYDPLTGVWIPTGPLAAARSRHSATLLTNGWVLAAGGQGVTGPTNCVEIFDPVIGGWSVSASMTAGHSMHTATLLSSGKVLVAGGQSDSGTTNRAELYNPVTGTWTPTGALLTGRSRHTATLLGSGQVLVAGGLDNAGNALASVEIYDPVNGTWSLTGSMNFSRGNHTAVLLPSGKVLVAGGTNSQSGQLASVELYDPSSGTWTATTALTQAREKHSATLLPNGQVFITGGINSSGYVAGMESYDPVNATWTANVRLSAARASHTAAILTDGRIFIAGGAGSSGILSTAEIYDPAHGAWTNTGDMINTRERNPAVLLPNGKVLSISGYHSDSGVQQTACDLYDPATGTWSATGPVLVEAESTTATLLFDGTVLMAGGYRGVILQTVQIYHPSTGTWSGQNSLHTGRTEHTATLLKNGKVLVAGGASPFQTASAEIYDPAIGAWVNTGSMMVGRVLHSATLLKDGRVLVAGGAWAYSEIYDPAAGAWTGGAPMGTMRFRHTATLLPNGTVLVVGGNADGFGQPAYATTEIFDPASDSWTAGAPMATARLNHTATLLPNGKVLVIGGATPNNTATASAEIYDPATGTWTTASPLAVARQSHTATLLPSGKVLVAGGDTGPYTGHTINTSELYDPGLSFNLTNRPQIATATAPVVPGKGLVLTGSRFRGSSEGSGGVASSSPADHPVVLLQSMQSDQMTFLRATNWSNNAIFSSPVAGLPSGYLLATVFVNGIPSQSTILLLTNSLTATVALSGLSQTYDGTAHAVSATTTPAGLAVNVFYNGSLIAPTDAGSYVVGAAINDATYQGTAGGTLVIHPAAASVALGNLSQVYDGTARSVTYSTTPSNLETLVTYNGGLDAPSNIGAYSVAATITDPNYQGATNNTLRIVIPYEATNVLAAQSATLDQGQTRDLWAGPESAGQGGLSLTASNGGNQSLQVIIAGYATKPAAVPVFQTGAVYTDIRVWGADLNDSMTANFYYPSTITGTEEDALNLAYWDGSAWSMVRGTGGSAPVKNTMDDLDSTVSGGRLRVVLDATSTPTLTGLTGTVFAIASPLVPPSAPILTAIPPQGDGAFRFTFTSAPSAVFRVFTTTNLSTPFSNWSLAGSVTGSPSGQYQFINPLATNSSLRFYRVVSP